MCVWSTENERGMIFMQLTLNLSPLPPPTFHFLSLLSGKEIYFVIFSVVTLTCEKIGDICCQTLLNFTFVHCTHTFSSFPFFSLSLSISSFTKTAFVERRGRRSMTCLETSLVKHKERKWEWNTCQVWCSQLYIQHSLSLPLAQSLACRVTNDRTPFTDNSFISMTIYQHYFSFLIIIATIFSNRMSSSSFNWKWFIRGWVNSLNFHRTCDDGWSYNGFSRLNELKRILMINLFDPFGSKLKVCVYV